MEPAGPTPARSNPSYHPGPGPGVPGRTFWMWPSCRPVWASSWIFQQIPSGNTRPFRPSWPCIPAGWYRAVENAPPRCVSTCEALPMIERLRPASSPQSRRTRCGLRCETACAASRTPPVTCGSSRAEPRGCAAPRRDCYCGAWDHSMCPVTAPGEGSLGIAQMRKGGGNAVMNRS